MTSTLRIRIDLGATTPVYRQIAGSIRALLVEGAFGAGAALPTVRQLAIDLGLNHNTVAEAYRLLADEGWLDLRRGHGVTVRDRARPHAPPAETQSFARRLRELIAEAVAQGVSRSALQRELQHANAALQLARKER